MTDAAIELNPLQDARKTCFFSRIAGEGRGSLLRAALALALEARRDDPGFDQIAANNSAFRFCASAAGALLALGGEAALREQKAILFLQPPNA